MNETKELLRRGVGDFEPMPDAFEHVLARRDRKHRNQRIAAGVLGIAVFALAAIGLVRLLGSERTPADEPQRSPFEGAWVSTTDGDGGTQTMTVRVSDDGAVEIEVRDDVASACSGTPSTMTGTGRIEDTKLIIPAPVYTCDNGGEPTTPSGLPLQEQLRDWTLFPGALPDTLSDAFGGVWLRAPYGDAAPLWPQTSLEEVRQAQALADAGDPRYTWQVAKDLDGQVMQHHPSDAQIFGRFLQEELGWEGYRWDEAAAHPDGLRDGDVVFIRCAPGGTNPLYPDAPDGCAPTLDDLRYETVAINVAQFDRQGPHGIWVVTGYEELAPFQQVAPPSDAEVTALLDPFLQARIDGHGAEGLADVSKYDEFASERVGHEIPLLYTTSTGAPYERSEFRVVDGPAWPDGSMQVEVRLFANNDEVHQVFSLERDDTGRLRLVYDFGADAPDGPGLVTSENGKPVPVEYGFLDGEVTYRATYPAEPDHENWYRGNDRSAVIAGLPFHNRNLTILMFLTDPLPVGPGCEMGAAPADAEALARSLRTNPNLEATAPVPVTVAGTPALQIDVLLGPDAPGCPFQLPAISGSAPLLLQQTPIFEDQLVRLYLLDLPEGSAARVLAIVINEADVDHALELAAPIIDSVEFHVH